MIKEENNTIDDNMKTEIDVFGSYCFEGTVEGHNSSDIINVEFRFDGQETKGTVTPETLKISFHIDTINIRVNELASNINKLSKQKPKFTPIMFVQK